MFFPYPMVHSEISLIGAIVNKLLEKYTTGRISFNWAVIKCARDAVG